MSDTTSPASGAGLLQTLDDAKISKFASAFGAIIFGRVADMLGRKRIYGYEC